MNFSGFYCPSNRRGRNYFAVLVAFALVLTACAAPPRPTLVTPPGPAPAVTPLELDLAPAPDTVAPLPPASPELPLESSVDDALLAWALERNVPYVDGCARATPQPDQLCDSPTNQDTVRLLGPSSDNIWYVITVDEVSSFDLGTGYRVASVRIAGR